MRVDASILKMEKEDRVIVEGLIKDNPKGISIQEMSEITKFNRVKMSNILAELKGEGKISVREIGQVKLHYWIWEKEK